MKKTKKIGLIAIGILIIAGIIAILSTKFVKKVDNMANITDPETLRAMSYGELTEGDANVDNCDYVQFSAFFTRDLNKDGYAERVKGTCKEIGKTDTLYFDLNVLTQGYLKNGRITLNGKNFTWTTSMVDDNSIIDGNYIGQTSSIKLKDEIKNGSQKLFFGTINSKIGNNINNYSKVNSITLTGIYVDDEGNETPINKTVDVTVDWYGTTKTSLNNRNQNYNIETLIKDEKAEVNFSVTASETNYQLILQKQEVEIIIPDLNGYVAEKVEVINSGIIYEYNQETKKLKIVKESIIDENGNVSQISRSSTYDIKVIYPLEAYTSIDINSISLSIPMVGYDYGYNNSNEEFDNPHISQDEKILTVTYSEPSGDIWNIYTYVGYKEYMSESGWRYVISKEPVMDIYNGNIYKDVINEYPVEWKLVTNDYSSLKNITLEEQQENEKNKADEFLNTSYKYTSMHDYIKTRGIYFVDADKMFGTDGWIKLYNAETGSLLETFTSETWGKYSSDNLYKVDVKSIKIETSAPIASTSFSVMQIKQLDSKLVTSNFIQSEFERISYIYTYLKGTASFIEGVTVEDGNSTSEINKSNYADYEMPYSVQSLEIDPMRVTNQETQNINLYIETNSLNILEKKWIDGVFLLELPEDILKIDIRNIMISNNHVRISSYNTYEKNGKKYIQIYTENPREQIYRITINADIVTNPLKATSTQVVTLYAYNKNGDNYISKTNDIYDIDNDGESYDNIGYSTDHITLIAPSGLITAEYITNYDDLGSITIAPNIAEIEKSTEKRTATVNVSITNNYNGTISEIKVLGKIPFEGNTYVLNEGNLNSQYTTNLKGSISIPEGLQSYLTIYYSEKANPNKDINDESNGWMLENQVSDWSTIKTYLINFNEYILKKSESRVLSYEIEVPAGVGYNDAAFSTHAIYYSLDTEHGKLPIQTEPNKVGIQVVSKYNMELLKNKITYDNMFVQGATYTVITTGIDGDEITKTETTNANGLLKFNGLYIEREYILKEVSSPSNYVLNNNEIKFKTEMNENEEPSIIVLDGKFKQTPEITIDENGNYLAKVKVEDEAKYTLTINKFDENGQKLGNVKFRLNGQDNASEVYKTNEQGLLVVTGLTPNYEYEIQEIKADGYYVDQEPRKFKIVRNETGKLEMQTEDGILNSANIIEEDGIIQANVSIDIDNEKIPTYTLQILKVEENLNEKNIENLRPLRGANFKVESIDLETQKEYITDDSGCIQIDGLYQYVEGKYISGEYVLQELKAPNGYSNNAEEIKFKTIKNEDNSLSVEIENIESLTSCKDVIVEGNIVKIIVQDKPLFKITKIDSETGEVLANAKFVIYEVTENGRTGDYAKDVNGEYVGEKNQDGQYIVVTDENGVISVPLSAGTYKIVEVGYPDGYQEKSNEEIFKINGEETEKIIQVNYIEDLVEISESAKYGNNYKDTTILLMRTLDFEDESSYRNPEDKNYGDLNENGKIEGIMQELINKNGRGFIPIGNGKTPSLKFSGNFNGQGNEIRNLYVSTYNRYAGLFGYVENGKISNLGVTGNIKSNHREYDNPNGDLAVYAGGISGYIVKSNITNVYNLANVSGINYLSKATTYSYCGGIIGYSSDSTIKNSYNRGDVSSTSNTNSSRYSRSYAGGIIGYITDSNIQNSYNTGNITTENTGKEPSSYAGGIVAQGKGDISNSYYLETITIDAETINILGTELFEEFMKTEEFVELLNSNVWNNDEDNRNNQYPVLVVNYEETEDNVEVEEINYIEDLLDLAESVNRGNAYINKNIKLMTSLDFKDEKSYRNAFDTSYGDINNDGIIEGIMLELTNENGIGFTPIGDGCGGIFSGIFDGQGNEIRNIYIKSSSEYLGLFGYINDSQIKDLGVTGIINSEGTYVGGIVGYASYSDINNSYNKINININSSGSYSGGISGYSKNSIINNCYNIGNLTTKSNYCGGITAFCSKSTVNNSYNKGNIIGEGYGQGGIVGKLTDSSSISNCYNIGNVTGKYVGGIVGYSYICTMKNVYNKGNIEGIGSYAGGIIGYLQYNSIIENSYTTGNVTNSSGRAGAIGGYITDSRVINGYYLNTIEVEGSKIQESGRALEESYMKTDTFVKDLNDNVWNKDDDTGYPTLKMEFIKEGKEIKEIYYIEDLVDLAISVNSGNKYRNKKIKLMRTLDFKDQNSYRDYNSIYYGDLNNNRNIENIMAELTNKNGIGFTPIGTGNAFIFSGEFDGQGNEIRNIYINSTSTSKGLFGEVYNGKITNLGITGEMRSGKGIYFGAIAGYINNSNIDKCYNMVNISGVGTTNYIGGIIGCARNSNINNSYNTGNIISSNTSSSGGAGGIAGYIVSSNINKCYNIGDITSSTNTGGIVGYMEGSNTNNSYNTGVITGSDVGGITGFVPNCDSSTINNCYNIGNIIANGDYNTAGGIAGLGEDINNCYNTGTITNYEKGSSSSSSAGGIIGRTYAGQIKNCYNTGNVISTCQYSSSTVVSGKIVGGNTFGSISKCYALNTIKVTGPSTNSTGTYVSDSHMMSESFYNTLNTDNVWSRIENEYPILLNQTIAEKVDTTEITIENTIKRFKITTDVTEINGVKGGNISGEDESSYEIVTIYNSNEKEIIMKPDAEYGISNITINGEKIEYIVNENGEYYIPAGYFEKITEDKHIVVTYSLLNKMLTINKVDEIDNNQTLQGAKFKVEYMDERPVVTNEVGNITANGQLYTGIINKNQEITDVLGEMTQNGTYYFNKNGNVYQPNNKGIHSSTANSYVKIDLTEKTGEYKVIVNAAVSSESGYDFGYATITQTTTAPLYSSSTGQFIKMSGTSSSVTTAKDYESTIVLEGGNIYYLHFGYRKDGSSNGGNDTYTINNIKVYGLETVSYYFEESNGKYISNNQGKHSTTANSYIPIDLRNTTGKYNLKVNAGISSQSNYDYGYVTITETTAAPSYSSTIGRLFRISGTVAAKDYTTILEAGKLYYVHLGYYKNSGTNTGTDTFTVNSIELSLNQDDYFNGELTTNKYGEIKQALNPAKYKITEIQAPEGYTLNSEPIIIDINEQNEITITNKRQQQIIVHHYLKNPDGTYTTQKVAEDEIYKGDLGTKYETNPHVDLNKLYLEKDENGEFVIPENATGVYTEDAIEVIYYYEPEGIKLTIHHYLEGTEVKLKEDITEYTASTITFDEEGNYTVTCSASYELITNEEYKDLLKDYELSSITSSVKEELTIEETVNYETDSEITYYYKLKDHIITTEVKNHTELRTNELTNEKEEIKVDGGNITGQAYIKENGIKFVETVDQNKDSKIEIVADPDPYYNVKEIKLISTNDDGEKVESVVYGEGVSENPEITCTEDENGNVTLTTFKSVTENKHIIVEFEPILSNLIVHHYIEGTGEEFGTDPVKVPSVEVGKVIEDEERSDYIGESYASRPSENIASIYELVSTSGDLSGKYKEGTIHIYYYYNYKDYKYEIHYFYDGKEDKTKIEHSEAAYADIISEYPDKPEGYSFEKVTPENEQDKTKSNLKITDNEKENIINVYYRTQFKVTTDVLEHSEEYKDGTIKENVKGGQISGEDEAAYENILKGYQPEKTIKITPDEGYEITKIVIKENKEDESGKVINLDDITFNSDGSVNLPTEYIADKEKGMLSNKHVDVEFRKKTNIIVKHLEEETGNVLYQTPEGKDYEVQEGIEGTEFKTGRKAINGYVASSIGITDENNKFIETYSKVTTDKENYANGTMYADTLTIIYWYKKADTGIIVRHLEINEKDKKQGLTEHSGVILDEELLEGSAPNSARTTRNNYEEYISVNGPESADENLVVVEKTSKEKEVLYKDDAIVEVRYYYEKQYNITTEVKPHTEVIDEVETTVDGGTISKEYTTNGSGEKVETVYEKVLSRGDNQKTIVIRPDKGYKVKSLIKQKKDGETVITSEDLFIEDIEKDDYSIVLPEAYIKDIQNDYHIVVEFERMPTKVIVEHKDIDTDELIEEEIIEGLYGDKYKTEENQYDDYIFVESKYPENSTGKMTEETIIVTYWYTKQFKITTDVIEHTEVDKDGNVTKEKGGKITAEDQDPYEEILRGNSNTLDIEIEPVSGYRIKEIQINGNVVDYINDENIVKEGNLVKIPGGYFENMQENKHITVEFEQIPAIVKVWHLEEGTEKVLYTTPEGIEFEQIDGYVNETYETKEKEIKYYELVQEKYPSNSTGTMTEEEIVVKYYYRKLTFNMKVEKEIEKITVNGEETSYSGNNKLAKVEIKYKEIDNTKVEVSYKIKVTNTEKVEGIVVLEELIPEGFEFVVEASDERWKIEDGKFVLETEEIKPGETKEYKVTLRWLQSEENKGQKTNTVKIADTENGAGYDETTKEDNQDMAVVEIKLEKTVAEVIDDIVSDVKTGDVVIVSIMTLVIAGAVLVITIKKKK